MIILTAENSFIFVNWTKTKKKKASLINDMFPRYRTSCKEGRYRKVELFYVIGATKNWENVVFENYDLIPEWLLWFIRDK